MLDTFNLFLEWIGTHGDQVTKLVAVIGSIAGALFVAYKTLFPSTPKNAPPVAPPPPPPPPDKHSKVLALEGKNTNDSTHPINKLVYYGSFVAFMCVMTYMSFGLARIGEDNALSYFITVPLFFLLSFFIYGAYVSYYQQGLPWFSRVHVLATPEYILMTASISNLYGQSEFIQARDVKFDGQRFVARQGRGYLYLPPWLPPSVKGELIKFLVENWKS